MKDLKRNIRLLGVLKIFTKRVFIPLTIIYLVEVGHLSIAQIGLLATISAVVSLSSDIPTGYFADRLTRKSALMIGAAFAAWATLFYAFFPFFYGAIIATILEAIGYSFLSGPAEALIHDTLVALDEEDNYPKVVGRAQSFGLIGNTILVSLVPLSYQIDKRLPFIFGTVAYVMLILISSQFVEPPRTEEVHLQTNPFKDLALTLRVFVTRASLLIFIAIGLICALYNTTYDFTNLIFKDLGLNPSHIGFVFGASSVAGIIGGYFIHLLRDMKLRTYALIDTCVFASFMLAVGLTHNLWVAIGAFVLMLGWWRLRSILYQHHLLRAFKRSGYKATLISTLSFFIRSNEVWVPFVFVGAINLVGYYTGYIWIGSLSALVLIPLFLLATTILSTGFDSPSDLHH